MGRLTHRTFALALLVFMSVFTRVLKKIDSDYT